jgi:LysM repeat protein
VDAHRRKELVRVAAPLAFLLVATAVVLLARSAMHESAAPATTVTTKKHKPPRKPVVVPVAGSTEPGPTTVAPAVNTYTVASGDTLGSIAAKEGTTVDELTQLNPGVDPTNLQIGDRIRVP